MKSAHLHLTIFGILAYALTGVSFAEEFNITRRLTCIDGTAYRDTEALVAEQSEEIENRFRRKKRRAREEGQERRWERMKKRLKLIRECLDDDNNEPGGSGGSGGSGGGTGGGGESNALITLESGFAAPHKAFRIFSRRYRIRLASQVVTDVYFTEGVTETKAYHAATVILQYLDNNEDGVPDNALVAQTLSENRASLIMSDNRNLENNFNPPDGYGVQPLYEDETHPGGAAHGQFDFALEECLHLVFTSGYALVYPDVFGESRGSYFATLMENARNTGHYNPFANEPGMDYPSQVSEYQSWALTSMLGAQDLPGRPGEIQSEWTLYTNALVQDQDLAICDLLTNAEYALATVLPDGMYGN